MNARGNIIRWGFTLIELLVVIAIIALLVGILLPALSAAREASQDAQCKSNLRSMGQGFVMYSEEDMEGHLPNSRDFDNASAYWYVKLNRYANADKKTGFGYDYMRCPTQYPDSLLTYGMNYYGVWTAYLKPGHPFYIHPGPRIDDVEANVYLTGDCHARDWDADGGIENYFGHINNPEQGSWPIDGTGTGSLDWDGDGILDTANNNIDNYGPYNGWGPHHLGGTGNFLFVDGHVRAATIEEWIFNHNGLTTPQ